MNYSVVALLCGLLFAAVIVAMWIGWRRQRAAQSAIYPAPESIPLDRGPATEYAVAYVATTRGSDPFARVFAHGLGFRGNGTVAVTDGGISITREGERDVYIPASHVSGVEWASTAIDRGVETDGLIAVAWRLGGLPVVTTLRPRDSATKTIVFDAMARLLPVDAGTIETTR